MRDRLIELLNKSFAEESERRMVLTAQYTADYLLENGVIVLPCKLGKNVYDAKEFIGGSTYAPEIYEVDCDEVTVRKKNNGEYLFTYDGEYIYFEDIGESVFSTEEEAIEKIQALKGGVQE